MTVSPTASDTVDSEQRGGADVEPLCVERGEGGCVAARAKLHVDAAGGGGHRSGAAIRWGSVYGDRSWPTEQFTGPG